jgi:hypothetical protein
MANTVVVDGNDGVAHLAAFGLVEVEKVTFHGRILTTNAGEFTFYFRNLK